MLLTCYVSAEYAKVKDCRMSKVTHAVGKEDESGTGGILANLFQESAPENLPHMHEPSHTKRWEASDKYL